MGLRAHPSKEILTWRLETLLRAGFEPGLATCIADSEDVDLHQLLDLVGRGCPPELAARILAPLDSGPCWSTDD
jgi:hypothetical protein